MKKRMIYRRSEKWKKRRTYTKPVSALTGI